MVKRLSRASGQGLREFKYEDVLISKLHRNLARLLDIVLKEMRRFYSMNTCPTKALTPSYLVCVQTHLKVLFYFFLCEISTLYTYLKLL